MAAAVLASVPAVALLLVVAQGFVVAGLSDGAVR
jgi:ABC-type maltose transport system permease subunit